MTAPRIALLAAFPFPAPLGSQRYFGEQARALAETGAHVTLFCYASGEGATPPGTRTVRAPRQLSPRALRKRRCKMYSARVARAGSRRGGVGPKGSLGREMREVHGCYVQGSRPGGPPRG